MLGSRRHLAAAAAFLGLAGIGGALALAQGGDDGPPVAQSLRGPGLTAFRNESELRAFLRRVQVRNRRAFSVNADAVSAPPPAPAAQAAEGVAQDAEPSITNNQTAGVDEGGIVKNRGDLLVMLRRGRLFTVSTAGGGMRAIDAIDASPPGVEGGGDWYDEMLISGDRVIVVGYSYRRGGTEINRFRLSPEGRLRFEDAYHLRSNDYYSSRNYASRLIGNRLVYYTPLYLGGRGDPFDSLPAMRRWDGKADAAFRRIAAPTRIFMPPRVDGQAEASIQALHSVIDCDLTAPTLDCSAVGVLGPASRTFYVAQSGVYLWISDWAQRRGNEAPPSFVYRLPFGNERPSAIAARGAPVDQFSFREDPADGMLNVLVRAEGGGDAMWRPEVTAGDIALLRLPIAAFGDGSVEAPKLYYRSLPRPEGQSWNFHNRFAGSHILYGGGGFGEGGKTAPLVVAPVRGGPVTTLNLAHAVERIELLGSDAIVVGGNGSGALGFSAIELDGRPRIGNLYLHPAAAEGETRSHAYFYRPDPGSDGSSGLLGLPVARQVDPAYRRFFGSAAAMLFLRRDNREFAPAGELGAEVRGTVDDGCVASCVDWYGNARPIFMRGRIFALLGYELVEGSLERGRIREIGRLNYAPPPRLARRG